MSNKKNCTASIQNTTEISFWPLWKMRAKNMKPSNLFILNQIVNYKHAEFYDLKLVYQQIFFSLFYSRHDM